MGFERQHTDSTSRPRWNLSSNSWIPKAHPLESEPATGEINVCSAIWSYSSRRSNFSNLHRKRMLSLYTSVAVLSIVILLLSFPYCYHLLGNQSAPVVYINRFLLMRKVVSEKKHLHPIYFSPRPRSRWAGTLSWSLLTWIASPRELWGLRRGSAPYLCDRRHPWIRHGPETILNYGLGSADRELRNLTWPPKFICETDQQAQSVIPIFIISLILQHWGYANYSNRLITWWW